MEEIITIALMSPDMPAEIADFIRNYIERLPVTLTNGSDENLCAAYLRDALSDIRETFIAPSDPVTLQCSAFREMAP